MKNLFIFLMTLAVISCSSRHSIEITNPIELQRQAEIAAVNISQIRAAVGYNDFIIRAQNGSEVPYQITHDSLLVFPVTAEPLEKVVYRLEKGSPSLYDTIACGNFYAQRKDDFAWENDKAAYRAYGAALQASGERAYGYDVWTKSVSHPVVAKRYRDALAKIANFHEDNGDGMDVYTVGPTLGAGTAALIDPEGEIAFPWCFESYEILDNGPLRFCIRLNYPAGSFGNDSTVKESRLITLDAGEYLNRTEVHYHGLSDRATIAPGIVVHQHNPDGYLLDNNNSFMAYADLTDNPDGQNGIIYVGVVAPWADSLVISPMPNAEGDAVAHLLAKGIYEPGSTYVYYWGSGWSKGFMPDWQQWTTYLGNFRKRIENPLTVNVK